MPEGFDAGSIFVRLQAEISDFNAGLQQAKDSLDNLASGSKDVEVAFQELDTSVVVFQEIEQRSNQARQAFSQFGAETQRSTQAVKGQSQATTENDQVHQRAGQTWARSANRILAIQLALINLSQNASGPAKDAIQALSNGMSAFGAAMQVTGGKIGLFNAGLLGIGVAVESFLFRAWEDSIKAQEAATDQMEKTRKATDAMRLAISDAKLAIDVFGGTSADKLIASLHIEEAAFASNAKRIRDIGDEIGKLKNEQDKLYSPDRSGQIEALEQERLNLNRAQDTIRKTGAFDKANADVAKMLQSTKDLATAMEDVGIKGKSSLEFGVSTPLEVATKNASEAKTYFEKLLDDNVKIVEESQKYNITLEQRAEILKKLHPLDQLQAAAEDAKTKKALEDTQKRVLDLAQTFSTSIGDGLRDAIINAQKPMEALATVGKNLFANMVDQTVKRLETGLTDAFKAITGAAGEGIGLAITGILGAAGAILSRLGSKSSNSFNPVQSAVTSTQAVRGIVAGPSSVAIADVGDNLSRAMAPVVSLLQGTNGWLSKIEANTRGRGPAGPGFPAVAAPTA